MAGKVSPGVIQRCDCGKVLFDVSADGKQARIRCGGCGRTHVIVIVSQLGLISASSGDHPVVRDDEMPA